MSGPWPWAALAALGAFHGANPAMGWLFAVALGLQRRSRATVLWALLPIALGHALSIGVVVLAVAVLSALLEQRTLQIAAALLLVAMGLYRWIARHRVRGGMQVTFADLALWSFLMATAHGAGIMLLPVLLGMPMSFAHAASGHGMAIAGVGSTARTALAAVAVHTAAMLAVTGAVALLVYDWIGLAFLRRGWINLDLLWAWALIGAGVVLMVSTRW